MSATPSTSASPRHRIAPSGPPALDFDVYLVLIAGALLAIGLLMVYSTTFDWSYQEYGSSIRIFLNQLRSAGIGAALMALIWWKIDYRILRSRWVATGVMAIAIIGLAALLIINNNIRFEARRTLYEGSFQPGEAAKLALIIYFGAWLASRRDKLQKLGYGLIPFSILIGVMGGLIVLQPDLSTAAILALTAWTMFFVAGANIAQIAVAGGGALIAGGVLAWQFPYARERLLDHLTAMQDLTKASWHVQQAIIAFTAPGDRPGGSFSPNWFGIGLGESRQKFGFLPAPHTDSIFAIIGEELGLFGCLVVVTLYALFVWRAFKIARETNEPFGATLAAGIGAWIAYEAMLNVAVVTAIVPFTGVALPFISYGGSNLVVVMTACGLLMSVSRRRFQNASARPEGPPVFDWGGLGRRRGVQRGTRTAGE